MTDHKRTTRLVLLAFARHMALVHPNSFLQFGPGRAFTFEQVAADLSIGETGILDMVYHLADQVQEQQAATESTDARQMPLWLAPSALARVGPTHAQQQNVLRTKLDTNIGMVDWDTDMTTRILNALSTAGYDTLGQVVALSRKDLKAVKGLGSKSLAAVERTLSEMRLTLEMEVPWWSPPKKHD